MRLGACPVEDGCEFLVWAPRAQRVEVVLEAPRPGAHLLGAGERGYHHAIVPGVEPGARYRYRLDGGELLPDPASRSQPDGVFGASEVVAGGFEWTDAGWRGQRLEDLVLYEVHVGVFTAEGTFDAIVPRLAGLAQLGVTALELMPVAQFPGRRNWGYDGVFPFAVQGSYGGLTGLRRLVDACHAEGLAVVLDVVHNHLGPEGNCLSSFGPYFTDEYRTPWGPAPNFSGPESDEVRRYFIESALHWVVDGHVDGLRLDAVHAIVDPSACTFLEELGEAVHREADRLGRRVHVIAETDRSDARLVRPVEQGGFGLDARWNDDFHHSLHVLLTGEQGGYYQDFGDVEHLARAFQDGHGRPPQLVVYAQNHDQVGNRARGDRLAASLDPASLRLAAATLLLSPFTPLLFMGEEYGETAPFLYFADHSDPTLVEAVRRGRAEELARFRWRDQPADPFAEPTFRSCRLDPGLRERRSHHELFEFHRELLRLRRELPALRDRSRGPVAVQVPGPDTLEVRYGGGAAEARLLLHFAAEPVEVEVPPPSTRLSLQLGPAAALPRELAPGRTAMLTLPPRAAVLYAAEQERPT